MANKTVKFAIICFIVFSFSLEVKASQKYEYVKIPVHKHNEASYQQAWCSLHNGITEYENADKTRVDCLTSAHAVEFDFARKWAESIGQALHYGIMTGKKPMVVLILENPKKQMCYYERVKRIAEKYDIDTQYVTNDILKPDKEGRCQYPGCKCRCKK